MTSRPYLSKVHSWEWRDKDGNTTPGIVLRQGRRIVAHLNRAEAIKLSNQLVDLAEQLEESP